eukprot:SAG22_NODE_3820_length_1515_cov_2.293079_3_plen_28_part_01
MAERIGEKFEAANGAPPVSPPPLPGLSP